MKYDLRQKTVVLSGASGGIGREIATILVEKYGANVIGIGRNEQKLADVKSRLGDAFRYFVFDVSEKENWLRFAEKMRQEGTSINLLINNAGVFPQFNSAFSAESEVYESVMRINFLSVVYAVEAILPLLKQSGSAGIYNVCSSSALCPVAGTGAYSASKSALKAYTETLMHEKRRGVYVGVAYPGATITDLFRNDERVVRSGIEKIASSAQKTAKKIVRSISRRKARVVIGWDAVAMSALARLMPKSGPSIVARIMKNSGVEAFADVFEGKGDK